MISQVGKYKGQATSDYDQCVSIPNASWEEVPMQAFVETKRIRLVMVSLPIEVPARFDKSKIF